MRESEDLGKGKGKEGAGGGEGCGGSLGCHEIFGGQHQNSPGKEITVYLHVVQTSLLVSNKN